MDDETIQQDVSPAADTGADATETAAAEQEETRPLAPHARRADAMSAVAEKRKQQREEETRAWREMNGDETPAPEVEEDTDGAAPEGEADAAELAASDQATDGDEPAGEDAGDPGEEQAAAEAAQSDKKPETGWYEREDGTRVKRLKVNGEIKELTEEEYDRALSKDLAGDQKLRLAAETQRKLEQREAQLRQLEQQLQQPRELPSGESAEEMQALLKKHYDAVYEGDTDAASEIMQEILQKGRQSSTPNLEQLVDQAATRARQSIEAERQTASVNRGWDRLNAEYPEIVQDDVYLTAADAMLKIVRAENPEWEPEQVILETGRRAAEKFGLTKKAAQDAPPASSSQSAERKERKAQLKPIPKGGTTANRPKQEPQLDMSPEAKIARLRATRAV